MAFEGRGSGTQDDPFLFKNYEEFKYYMETYNDVKGYKYFSFDIENATTEDRETFDFNKISEIGIFNKTFIPHIHGTIDFKGLIVKNLYKQFDTAHTMGSSSVGGQFILGSFITSWDGRRYGTTIRNLKLFNLVLTGGTLLCGWGPNSRNDTYFVNCDFSGIIRSDGSSQALNFTLYSVFINCSFNLNIKLEENRYSKIYNIFNGTTFLANSTVKISGHDKKTGINKSNYLLLMNSSIIGTKIFGSFESYSGYVNQFTFTNGSISYDGQTITSGPSVFDFEYTCHIDNVNIQNPSVVVNKSKIILDNDKTLTLSSPEFGLQSTNSSASDYIYNLQNLERLGFTTAEEVD